MLRQAKLTSFFSQAAVTRLHQPSQSRTPRLQSPQLRPRLTQAVLSQFFPSAAMYRGDWWQVPEEWLTNLALRRQFLLPARRRPGLPTGNTSPLPFPPDTQDEKRRKIIMKDVFRCVAAAATDYEEYWHEQACWEANRDAAMFDPDFFQKLGDEALDFLRDTLGPRARAYVDREIADGGSLRFCYKQSGLPYLESARKGDDSPMAIYELLVAADAADMGLEREASGTSPPPSSPASYANDQEDTSNVDDIVL
ncbi:hypothetical protein GGX14DRAFT_578927 [Mycena pura]|uniref:Uncharacterized protein n=1 Tax=Mycena pura TaxID=153505 RepID=A0AAD6UNY5_9AGAR|nr:hypothetical protein GGX14DRAFT_578927 [Mycena pura]